MCVQLKWYNNFLFLLFIHSLLKCCIDCCYYYWIDEHQIFWKCVWISTKCLWNHGGGSNGNTRWHKFLFHSNLMVHICLKLDQKVPENSIDPPFISVDVGVKGGGDHETWWGGWLRTVPEPMSSIGNTVNVHLKWHQSEMLCASDRELVIFLLNLTFYRSLRTQTQHNTSKHIYIRPNGAAWSLCLLRSIWRFIHGKFNQWNNMDKNTYPNHVTQTHKHTRTHTHTSTAADRVAAWAYYNTPYSAGKIQAIY